MKIGTENSQNKSFFFEKFIITWNLETIEGRIIFSKPHTQDALTWKDQTKACKRVDWDLFAHYAL